MSPITVVRSGWRVRAVVIVILISGLSAVVAARQDPGGVIALLQKILSSLTTLQESVDALSAADDSNAAISPPLWVFDREFGCHLVNVADSPRNVLIEMIRANGETILDSTQNTEAGQAGAASLHLSIELAYCKFTVLNGKKTDIRAAATISSDFNFLTELVAPAQ